MSLIRTFVAVEMSGDVQSRAAALVDRLRVSQVKATWTRGENLHLTLKFLGDVQDTRIPDVCRAVATAAQQFEPFVLQISGAGAFPRVTAPRTVWMGAGEGSEQIIQVQEAVDRELHECGFPAERRRFKPHLTIGRVREGGAAQDELGQLLEKHAGYVGGVTEIDELIIFSSLLERSGPTYHVLGRAPLLGGD